MRAAQQDLEGGWTGDGRGGERDGGEVIQSATEVTFILITPGYSARDFLARADETHLRVAMPGDEMVRQLACTVDPSTLRTSYVNGVLSVRMSKKS
ncbi:MAG: Hsp20/alpha crystallin family protein [Thaumarchaeota archaeon]|nr:Hsp20/alpha crystallin family protein [Nitrososphaerota archaeon]